MNLPVVSAQTAEPPSAMVTGERPANKARALSVGSRLAIVSPASAARPERVLAGVERLRALGFEPILAEHALGSGPLYFAGSVAERLADLHNAFADSTIDGVVCTRGGWGSAELLPGLDLQLIGANPKPFLGYSDHTSLHSWIGQTMGLVTFYAPMVSPDFARADGVDLPSFRAALTGLSPWTVADESGLRLLRAAKDRSTSMRVDGTLVGGCLSIVSESLGTPYTFAPREHSILFLEDVGTKPYQWNRMLLHLQYAGVLTGVRAIVFGDMRQCVEEHDYSLLEAALLHALEDFTGPVCIGLRSGHVSTPNVTLPLGVRVELDLEEPERPALRALESSVFVDSLNAYAQGEV